jgi:hypothetical protein
VPNTDGKNLFTLSNANLDLLKIMRCAEVWNLQRLEALAVEVLHGSGDIKRSGLPQIFGF